MKGRAGNITKGRGNSMKATQIQGQSTLTSFLEHKIISRTRSSNDFPNSSNKNNSYTTAVGSLNNYVGNKTTEASNETGGRTQQLSGEINLKEDFVRRDTIGQN